MKNALPPYDNYYIKAIYVNKLQNRRIIALIHNLTNKRYNTTYARYLMSVHLKNFIKDSCDVHHINGNSLDDRIENLQVLEISKHKKLHSFEYLPDQRIYKSGEMRICQICNNEFYISSRRLAVIDLLDKNKNSLNGKCCSRSCSMKLNHKKRKNIKKSKQILSGDL